MNGTFFLLIGALVACVLGYFFLYPFVKNYLTKEWERFDRELCYTPSAGKVCRTRPLWRIRKSCERKGFITKPTVPGFAFSAATEKKVIQYWDSKGRVAMTRFIGDCGACGTNGVTNRYYYDPKGRLERFEQIRHELDGTDVIFRSYVYAYKVGSNEFVLTKYPK